MSPPYINSLSPPTTPTQTTSAAQHPTTPCQQQRTSTTTNPSTQDSTYTDSGIIHFPYTTARYRSKVLMNPQLKDPALPAPGEMVSAEKPHPNPTSYSTALIHPALGRASPHSMTSTIIPGRDPEHNSAPSLGKIRQELEQEQEAQVNRLLQMIRIQQAQLQALQASHASSTNPSSTTLQATAIEDSVTSPTSTHQDTIPSALASAQISPKASSVTLPSSTSQPIPIPGSGSVSTPVRMTIHLRSSFDLSRSVRAGSRTPCRNASPGLPLTGRSPSIGRLQGDRSEEWSRGVSTRDEAQLCQAEAQMMTRENQMLRLRIRELEREVREKSDSSQTARGRRGSVNSYEPATPSSLIRGLSGRSGRESGQGQSRTEGVSEMGAEDHEDASPPTTPAPKTPQAQAEAKSEE